MVEQYYNELLSTLQELERKKDVIDNQSNLLSLFINIPLTFIE